MANVTAFQMDGLKIWFYSDDHTPAHFHVKKSGEWEMRVFFMLDKDEMIQVKWSDKKLSRKIQKEICGLAEEHRVDLLIQWEQIHSN
jgi:hypothetical protein